MSGDNLDLGVNGLETTSWIIGMKGNHFGGNKKKSLRNMKYSLGSAVRMRHITIRKKWDNGSGQLRNFWLL